MRFIVTRYSSGRGRCGKASGQVENHCVLPPPSGVWSHTHHTAPRVIFQILIN